MSELETMKAHILKEIAPGSVSYAELQRIPGFKGNAAPGERRDIMHGEFEHIVLWADVTELASQALRELQAEEKIHCILTHPFTYYIDGASLRLPIAKRPHHYKKDHWLPVVFNLGPLPQKYRK